MRIVRVISRSIEQNIANPEISRDEYAGVYFLKVLPDYQRLRF